MTLKPSQGLSLRCVTVEGAGQVARQMSAGPPRLPLAYAPIKEQDLSKLKLLNSVIFPINYQVGALPCVVQCKDKESTLNEHAAGTPGQAI